jgi:hypothetical protein
MNQNALPSRINKLISLAERIAEGLETYGPWLGMTQIPANEFRRILDDLVKAETAWSASRSAKASAQSRMVSAHEALASWLAKARLVVMLARGTRWSDRWIETGFIHRGTNVPKQIESRIALARQLVIFLALHPKFGVPFAEITAARGRSIYERTIQARDALDVATTNCRSSKRQRDGAERVLRRAMREVVLILAATIAPSDPRWLKFGLNQAARRSRRTHQVRSGEFAAARPEPIPLPAQTQPASQHIVAA